MTSPGSFHRTFCVGLLILVACGGKDDGQAGSGGDGGGDETSGGGDGGASTSASGTSGSTGSSGGDSGSASSTGTSTGTTTGTTGTSTGSGSDSGGGTEGGGTEGGFITPPDGGVTGQCDPFMQDCPEGEKCTAWASQGGVSTDANKCVSDGGTKEEFETCTRTMDNDDCSKGLFCMTKTSGSTGEGYCQKFCSVAEADSCPEGTCVPWNDGTKPVCEYPCDPLVQDCDQPNFGCYPGNTDGFFCKLSGFEEGSGTDGSACVVVQSCEPGFVCAAAASLADCASTSCCTQVCDVANPTETTCDGTGEECVPYFAAGTAPPDYENVGLCGLPA